MSELSSYIATRGLGMGSFGKVKRMHKLTGTEVALKYLDKQKVIKSRAVDKLRTEISILRSLSHTHIISLFEVIETADSIVLVTEYASGGELYDQVERSGRLSESRAHMYFSQLIQALDYCHSRSVAHRDIKLENILIDKCGNLKLADFGLASFLQDGDFLNTACGSPNYAPPELLIGKPYDGPTADVWSSGVVLYAIATGALPFDEVSMPALHGKIKEGIYKMPYYLSDSLKDLLFRMLNTDPVNRISIEQVKRHPWVCRDYMLCKQISNIDSYEEILRSPSFKMVKFSNEEVLEDLKSQKQSEAVLIFKLLASQRSTQKQKQIPMFKNKCNKDTLNSYSLRNQDTAASSPGSQNEEIDSTNSPGWCYGLAVSVDLRHLIPEIIGFLETNEFEVKQTDRFRIRAEDESVSLEIQIYTYEDQYFVNVRLVKSPAMIGLETAYKVLSFIQAYSY